MLYGSTCFSELPLSTIKPQLPNGDDFDYDLIIDQLFGDNLCIQQELDDNIFVCQNPNFPLWIDLLAANDLIVDKTIEFTLVIEKNENFGV